MQPYEREAMAIQLHRYAREVYGDVPFDYPALVHALRAEGITRLTQVRLLNATERERLAGVFVALHKHRRRHGAPERHR